MSDLQARAQSILHAAEKMTPGPYYLEEELLDGNGYSSDSAICSHVQSMFLAAGEIIRAYDSEDAKQRDGDA